MMKILCLFLVASIISSSYSHKKDVVKVGDYVLTYYADGDDLVAFGAAAYLCTEQGRGDRLVKVNEEYIYDAVQIILRDYGYPRTWAGASDARSPNFWQWLDYTPMKSGFTKWYPGEPNNLNGVESCLNLGEYSHYFNDLTCTHKYGYICQADDSKLASSSYSTLTYSDTTFDENKKSQSFWNAQSECRKQGSRLVEVEDMVIYGIIQAKLESLSDSKYWIGGTFKDIDGKWKRVEDVPDISSSKGTQKCVAMDSSGWNEYDCNDDSIQFICQTVQPYNLKITDENPSMVESDHIKIDCESVGYPVPFVTWSKNKVSLSHDDAENVHQSFGAGRSSLIINEASLSDAGQYECLSYNYINGTKHKIRGFTNIKVFLYGTDLSKVDINEEKEGNDWMETYEDFMNRHSESSTPGIPEPTEKDDMPDCPSETSDKDWMVPTIIALACLWLLTLALLLYKSYFSAPATKHVGNEFTNNAAYAMDMSYKE